MQKIRWRAIHFAIFLCSIALLIGQLYAVEIMDKVEIYLLAVALLLVLLARKESRKNREFYSLVVEAPYGIILAIGRRIVFINKKGKDLLGVKEKEVVVGKALDEFITDFIPSKRKLEKGLKFNRIIEGKLLHPTKEELFLEIKFMPIVFRGKTSEYIVIRDITELKKSEELILQSDKLTMVGELAAGIAHEIRNPLTSLRGFAQLVKSEEKVDMISMYSEIMTSEIDRINGIVEELLLLAKPKKLHLKETSITNLFEDVVLLLQTQATLHNVQINTDYSEQVKNLLVDCEQNKLKQVFINVIKNSIEAMSSGGIVNIRIQQEKKDAIIKVVDQGSGIAKDKLEKIGKAFFSTKEKGTGLGLMICHTIIQDHGGNLTIDSEEGVGTTVTIRIPCHTGL
ncbi:ATP-binding protein [Fredinandcohnia humi]